jgi:hypothetical protein
MTPIRPPYQERFLSVYIGPTPFGCLVLPKPRGTSNCNNDFTFCLVSVGTYDIPLQVSASATNQHTCVRRASWGDAARCRTLDGLSCG